MQSDSFVDKFTPFIWAGIRILAGMLWIQNVGWKYPPDFEILGRSFQRGIDEPTWGPFSSFLESVVIGNLALFGWITLISELVVGAMLVAGFATRIAALTGAIQSLVIGLTVSAVDHEWGWSYWMMVGFHLALFASASGRYCGVDGVLRSRLGSSKNKLVGLYMGVAS